jgi:hypothetical protein
LSFLNLKKTTLKVAEKIGKFQILPYLDYTVKGCLLVAILSIFTAQGIKNQSGPVLSSSDIQFLECY